MKHTVHIMLGDKAERVLTDIKKYVIKYGSEEENTFFNAMLYREEEDGAHLYNARPRETEADTFVSGIENLYNIDLDAFYAVPQKNRAEYLQACFAALYDQKITINNPGDSPALHVCFYVPVYEKKYWERIREFLTAMDSIPQQYETDLFLLPSDLAFLMEDEAETLPVKMAAYQKQTKQTIEDILASKKTFRSLHHLILVQNCNANGLSLNLDEESFVRIIGEFALLTVSHYSEMFNISAQDAQRPIHALGLSVLSFDKYYFVQYLLHKAYIHILDREQVMQEEVDVNKVSQIVQAILARNVNVFSRFYDTQVKTRLDRHMDQNDIIAQIHPELQKEIERLTDECQSYIDSPEITLPEKKATLAQLLGEDDDLLIGYMFNKKQLVIDDCSREVLDFFVDANNRLFRMKEGVSEADLPMEQERKEEVNRIAENAVLSTASDEEIVMPGELLDELKSIKVSMRESSNYIRLKSGELQALGEQIHEHTESQKRLTEKGFVFDGQTFQLQSDVIEKPLEEDYKPFGSVPAKVDLRKYFTPVKHQGSLGACSAFALVGIYEYILRKNSKQDADLSEAFVYYNVRKMTNEVGEDPGSSLYNVVVTMGTEGVCTEHLCPYTEDPDMPQPSEAAYEDALQRKIVKALNVQKNINHIKAAVAEGYPVAVSLKIFESFEPVGGFISRPSQEEREDGKSGNHAMIVCGYSDEEKIFIVRNSWGTKFGDQGYCYIPYSYFEDFLNVACIITQINDTKLRVAGNDLKVTLSFDMSNSRIKSAILQILIEEEKRHLARLETVLNEKEIVYNKIFQALGNNSNRTSLCDGTIERLHWEHKQHTEKKEELQEERTLVLKAHRKETIKKRIKFGIFIGLFVLTYAFLLFRVRIPMMELFLNPTSYYAYGFFVLNFILFCFWDRRRCRQYKDLNEDYLNRITQEEQAIQQCSQQLEIMKLKSHVAGMIIDSLAKLFHNLHSKYNGMRSYVGNLREWRVEEETDRQMKDDARDPFLSLVSNSCLDRYFELCKDRITESIRLCRMFRNTYNVEEEEVIRFKNSLKQTLIRELFAKLEGFSIYRHIVGESQYDYVERDYTNLDALLQQMDQKSNHFVRTLSSVSSVASENTSCKMLFIDTDFETNRAKWKAICDKNFRFAPNLCKDDSQYKITLLQLDALEPREIAILA